MLREHFLASIVATVAAPSPIRIAALGDSLALGTGATRADGGFIFRAFRRVLADRPGTQLDCFAIGGATAADVLRLEAPRLSASRYDIVIVCAGGNDVVRGTSTGAFAAAYHLLIRRIADAQPAAKLICCGIPDVSVSPIFARERGSIFVSAYQKNRAAGNIARGAGAAFVDLFALTTRKHDAATFLGRDRFHPSDSGYSLLAQALTPVLQRSIASH
jgi:lysophospholipase L1-like esterase